MGYEDAYRRLRGYLYPRGMHYHRVVGHEELGDSVLIQLRLLAERVVRTFRVHRDQRVEELPVTWL